MTIRGSCSCYGHADECVAAREEDKDVEGMYQSYYLGIWGWDNSFITGAALSKGIRDSL